VTIAARPGSKTERFRQAVAEARDERDHLRALLALARHYAEASDGVNGLEAARAARAFAIRLEDWQAVAHALASASVSQYHRSDYVSALATAIDAWDAARRAKAPHTMAESIYAIALALYSLGEVDGAMRLADKGIELTATGDPALREPHVRLIGLKALLFHRQGRFEDTDAYCRQAVEQAAGTTPHLLELGHGNWALALLRTAEQRLKDGQPLGDLPARAREQFDQALRIATEQDDQMRMADRTSGQGQVAFLEGDLDAAEELLSEALRRSLELDYVRTAVVSARYLARIHLARGAFDRAIEVLTIADGKARRGAPVDGRPAVKLMLAGALEQAGRAVEAERVREAARELRNTTEAHRRLAAVEARKLAARVLEELHA
jgi:tetratricopeptide (TPR) repeat protein